MAKNVAKDKHAAFDEKSVLLYKSILVSFEQTSSIASTPISLSVT